MSKYLESSNSLQTGMNPQLLIALTPLLLSVYYLDVQSYFIKTVERSVSEGRPSVECQAYWLYAVASNSDWGEMSRKSECL